MNIIDKGFLSLVKYLNKIVLISFSIKSTYTKKKIYEKYKT